MGRSSEARERLINVAKEMVHASSYEAVSVDELCAAAGVGKSSFYHFFASKQDLMLTAIESRWQQFEELVLKPSFSDDLPPQERLLRFFDRMWQAQSAQRQASGHMRGCPFGNLTLEMSTRNELMRSHLEGFFQLWIGYFERLLCDARTQGIVPETLDVTVTAQALLAYIEGTLLLAKGQNDPALLHRLRDGVLLVMQYREKLPLA